MSRVKPEDVPDVVETTLGQEKVVERLLYHDNGNRYQTAADIPFYKLQQKVILKNVGLIDPLNLEEALHGGCLHLADQSIDRNVPRAGY